MRGFEVKLFVALRRTSMPPYFRKAPASTDANKNAHLESERWVSTMHSAWTIHPLPSLEIT